MDPQKTSTVIAVVAAVAVVALFLGGLVYTQNQQASAPAVPDLSSSSSSASLSDASQSDQTTQPMDTSSQPQPSQLQITDEVVGTGPAAKAGDHVYVNYLGTLTNGTKFDSSYDRGQPIDFDLGTGYVIKGWDQGLIGMKVGGKRKLVIPPSLGYGARANGAIPANSTLVFEVELVKIGQ